MPKAAVVKAKIEPLENKHDLGYSVKTEIELLAPLLYNKHPDERDTGRNKTEEEYQAEGRQKIHVAENGEVIVPAWNLKVALIAGCQKTFKGKNSITDKIKAFVFAEPASWGLLVADQLSVVWGRIPPRTGTMQKIYRPQINAQRRLTVRFNVINSSVDFKKLKEGWAMTGLMVGLGAWRPEYGRFRVLSFEKE